MTRVTIAHVFTQVIVAIPGQAKDKFVRLDTQVKVLGYTCLLRKGDLILTASSIQEKLTVLQLQCPDEIPRLPFGQNILNA